MDDLFSLYLQQPNLSDSEAIVHERLVFSRFAEDATTLRTLVALLSLVGPSEKTCLRRQILKVRDLIDLTETTSRDGYGRVQNAVTILQNLSLEAKTDNGGKAIPLFETIRYIEGSGLVVARFHEAIRPYLLKENASCFPLPVREVGALKTAYAMRHYMLGKKIQHVDRLNRQTITIPQYRNWLGLEDKYSRFTDLARRVLQPAMDEINQQSDLSMTFEVKRESRTPISIVLQVRPKQTQTPGTVYILRAGQTNHWKVGFTRASVTQRRNALQVGCPFPLEVFSTIASGDVRRLESRFHEHLAAYRSQGEWFEAPEAQIHETIRSVLSDVKT